MTATTRGETTREATTQETMVYAAAREIADGDSVFVGTGLPMLAAYLARATHAPNVSLLFESGIIDPDPVHLAHGVGDFRLMYGAVSVRGLYYALGLMQRGGIDIGFLGAAEVDAYGNINSTIIGGDYRHPHKRLPGSGGANDIASSARATVVICPNRPDKLVPRVQYITSPGFLGGAGEREAVGLRPGGPRALITDMAVFRFDPVARRAVVASLHEGVEPEALVAQTGFDVEIPDDTPRTPTPDDGLLALVRSMDPRGVYLKPPRDAR